MRTYKIPPNTAEKEKIIGGLLNLNQLFWILGGLGLGALAFTLLFDVIGGIPALVIGVLFVPLGMPFAFYKKNELTLFRYLVYRHQFKKKEHYLPNKRKDVL